jgi:4-hydroxythreonine-4-phosphate dehydrogenase
MAKRPCLLITLGDVAGIGPEIVARSWSNLLPWCRPVVIGDPGWLRWALDLTGCTARVCAVRNPEDADATPEQVPCIAASGQDLASVVPGRVSAAAGRAAFDFLCRAIDLTLAGQAAGIVTAPLHKEGLRAAGLPYPGHTEILAERTGSKHYAMLLSADGLTVAHVTLHMALRDVFQHLSTASVLEKVRLLDEMLPRLLDRKPRLGVAALNPHASDGGLFGDEEETIIRPAVEAARAEGIDVSGPWPSDTLFVRARAGAFDGLVVMYHDQGHIALKLLGGRNAVNISAGLPIIRTSVAHGTAYDIAGQGVADASGMVAAVRVAAQLARQRQPKPDLTRGV